MTTPGSIGRMAVSYRGLPRSRDKWSDSLAHPGGTAGVANGGSDLQGAIMLKWALIFFLIALVAGILGFGGIAAAAAGIAKALFFIFVVLFLIALIGGLAAGRKLTS